MTYVRPKRTFKLVFADEDMQGLEVRARSVSMAKLLELTKLAQEVDGQNRRDMRAVEDLLGQFADVLIDWNLTEEDGTPVPATLDGLLGEDVDFVLKIVLAWMDGVGDVPAPLARGSSGGGPSLEESIPMDAL